MSLLIPAENFLRTRNLRFHSGSKTFGMGYRPASARNQTLWANLPRLGHLLHAKGFSASAASSGNGGTRALCGGVFDQNTVGSCTSESSCKAGRVSVLTKYGSLPGGIQDFSQRIMYGQTRQIEAAASVSPGSPILDISDSGCEPADCVTAMSSFGLAPMEAPVGGVYNDVYAGNVNREIVLADEEKTSIMPGAHAVDLQNSSRVDEWKALCSQAKLGGTLALFVDTQNFMAYDGSSPIQKIDLGDPQGGGHQIMGPVDWELSPSLGIIWWFLNSWGDWGQAGFGAITDSCLMSAIDASLAFDIEIQGEVVGS